MDHRQKPRKLERMIGDQMLSSPWDHTVLVGTGALSAAGSWLVSDYSLAFFGVQITVLLAAFAGAAIGMSIAPRTELEAPPCGVAPGFLLLGKILAGTLVAAYGEPLAQTLLNLPDSTAPGIALVIGLTAMSVIPPVLKMIPAWINQMVGHVFYRGGKGDGSDRS